MTLINDRWLRREPPPYFDRLEIGYLMESSGRTLNEREVVAFTALTGNWHPKHVDAAWAAESSFGRRIVPGTLLISCAIGLLPTDPRVVFAVQSLESAELKRPVVLGDTIWVRAEVREKQPHSDEYGLVRLSLRIINQADQHVAWIGATLCWLRDPGRGERIRHPVELEEAPPTEGVDIDDELSLIRARR